jgi:hypothetical protein
MTAKTSLIIDAMETENATLAQEQKVFGNERTGVCTDIESEDEEWNVRDIEIVDNWDEENESPYGEEERFEADLDQEIEDEEYLREMQIDTDAEQFVPITKFSLDAATWKLKRALEHACHFRQVAYELRFFREDRTQPLPNIERIIAEFQSTCAGPKSLKTILNRVLRRSYRILNNAMKTERTI